MQSFNESMSIGSIVTQNPLTARVFHSKGLDFCCGGQISLGKACEKYELSVDSMIDELNKIENSDREFTVSDTTTAQEVINYILVRFHDTLREELPTLDYLMDKVANVHGERHPHLISLRRAYFALVEDLNPHMLKEEQILFPLIQRLEEHAEAGVPMEGFFCGSVCNPINQMEAEHNEVGNLISEIKLLTNEFIHPEDACNSYRSLYSGLEKLVNDLMLHVHMENNILHPMAKKLEEQVELIQ